MKYKSKRKLPVKNKKHPNIQDLIQGHAAGPSARKAGQNPTLSKADRALFIACRELNLGAIRTALKKRARVNILNEEGNSPLCEAISYSRWHCFPSDREPGPEEYFTLRQKGQALCVKAAEYLLGKGADPDLFGKGGTQPLLEAYYNEDVPLVRLLLGKGSNPNYNSYVTDIADPLNKGISSSVLYDIYGETDSLTPAQTEIMELVYRYGGRVFRWGFNPMTREFDEKCLVRMWPNFRESLFSDSEGAEVGDFHSLTLEREDGENVIIDLSDAEEQLMEWSEAYGDDLDPGGERKDLYERGLSIAENLLAPILPSWARVYYRDGPEHIDGLL